MDGTLTETPDRDGAFPRLTPDQISRLEEHGERRRVAAGDLLYREGDSSYDFVVVLEGLVAIVADHDCDAARVISAHGAGRFLGELNLLTGQMVYLTAEVVEPGEILVVPGERLRRLVASDQALGDVILRAYLLRRAILIDLGSGLRIVGSRFSPDTRRLREFVIRNRVPYSFMDLEEDEHAEALLRALHVSPEETPVVFTGRTTLRNPTNEQVALQLGIRTPTRGEEVCDLAVVGAGPAGLAAAVYGASEGLDTVALDAVATGGQAGTTTRIENYLGFPTGISGAELAERAVIQARKFGARVLVPASATALRRDDGHFDVPLDDGDVVSARTVVLATGARYRKLDVPRFEELEGLGVYYAATPMEAVTCQGQTVIVVGGGNSAGQAAMFLTGHSCDVKLVVRGADLAHSMSRYLIDQVERNAQIEVMACTEVRELIGDDGLEVVVLERTETAERTRVYARALFCFIGAQPHTDWLGECVAVDRRGFVLTGRDLPDGDGRRPTVLETSAPGVFAVGDVRAASVKRVASAVGEGSMAVRLVHQHLAEH